MDCLVTKLKSTVNNDSLPKLGVLKINVSNQTTFNPNYNINIRTNSPTTVVSSDVFYDQNGISIGNTINIPGTTANTYFRPSNHKATLDVNNKYSLIEITAAVGVFSINVDELNYSTSLQILNLRAASGSIDSLENCVALKNLTFPSTRVTGNLPKLGKCTSLTTLAIGSTAIGGSVEEFVARQRGAGRTTCSGISCNYLGSSRVTFGTNAQGQPIAAPNGESQSLSWTATQITIGSRTVDNDDVISE